MVIAGAHRRRKARFVNIYFGCHFSIIHALLLIFSSGCSSMPPLWYKQDLLVDLSSQQELPVFTRLQVTNGNPSLRRRACNIKPRKHFLCYLRSTAVLIMHCCAFPATSDQPRGLFKTLFIAVANAEKP